LWIERRLTPKADIAIQTELAVGEIAKAELSKKSEMMQAACATQVTTSSRKIII
jgi:hypothetical protein